MFVYILVHSYLARLSLTKKNISCNEKLNLSTVPYLIHFIYDQIFTSMLCNWTYIIYTLYKHTIAIGLVPNWQII